MSQRSKRRNRLRATQREAQEVLLHFREFEVRASSINTEDRSIEALITTETPVLEMDWDRYEMVPRILLTDGAIYPASRQIPLLDSHNRRSMDSQLGSIRQLTKAQDGVKGRLTFSTQAESQWTKVREGHVTDVSGGFDVLEQTYIPAKTTQTVAGRSFTGPLNVATKWRLYEGSVTPIGADDQAKLRGLDPNKIPQRDKDFEMNPEKRKELVSRGMPADLDDAKAMEWWQVDLNKTENERRKTEEERKEKERAAAEGDKRPLYTIDDVRAVASKAIAEATAAENTRKLAFRKDVDEICELVGATDLALRCYDLADMTAVRTELKKLNVERQKDTFPYPGGGVRVTGEGRETLRKDLETAIINRTYESLAPITRVATMDRVHPVKERGTGATRFQYASPMQIAEECLRADGFWRPGMSRSEIATAAMGFPQRVGFRIDGRNDFGRSGDGGAVHTTSSFGLITENAVNKSMMLGYVEGPSTWELLFRRGESVPDFKQIRRYQLSAAGDLVAWPDDTVPAETSVVDSKEVYGVEPYARAMTYSWQLLMNDDMGALTRTPMLLGNAARRSVNKIAWAPVTANANMRDGIPLFSAATGVRYRPNLTTGVATPTTTTVAAMRKQMRLMRGENTREGLEGPDILNLVPSFIVGCPSLEEIITVLTGSEYNPAPNQFQTKNTARQLVPLIEPLLEVNSATAWYLFAQHGQVDTVEVTFLQGNEEPVMWSGIEEKTLTRWFAIRLALGAKALDWRGIQRHDGV
jgi:hypothetical protein